MTALACIPNCVKNDVSSAGARICIGSFAKLAILVGVLYFAHKATFCMILPTSSALAWPVAKSTLENENPIVTFFSVANLQRT